MRSSCAAGHDLSSWVAYGPALAGGFLPSLALVLVGQDPGWRWVTVFVAAVADRDHRLVARRRRAPAVTGAAVAMVVAVIEMIRLLRRRARIAGAVAGRAGRGRPDRLRRRLRDSALRGAA